MTREEWIEETKKFNNNFLYILANLSDMDKWKITRLYVAMDNKNKNLNYCIETLYKKLGDNFFLVGGMQDEMRFYTKKLESFYKSKGKVLNLTNATWFCGYRGALQCGIVKNEDEVLIELLNNYNGSLNIELLTDEEWIQPYSNIQKKLNKNLDKAVDLIKEIDSLIP